MELGDIIKKYRTNNGFTQTELSLYLNLNQKELSKIESNITLPTFRVLHIIARKCGISLIDVAHDLLDEPSLSENKRKFLIMFFESII